MKDFAINALLGLALLYFKAVMAVAMVALIVLMGVVSIFNPRVRTL